MPSLVDASSQASKLINGMAQEPVVRKKYSSRAVGCGVGKNVGADEALGCTVTVGFSVGDKEVGKNVGACAAVGCGVGGCGVVVDPADGAKVDSVTEGR